jgi:hypothetical protein
MRFVVQKLASDFSKLPVFFLAFVSLRTGRSDIAHRKGGTAMRQFSVGEVVTWIPDLLLRWEAHGDYRIVAAMPDRDGDRMYRIKSPLEEYERVVKEGLLVNEWLFARRASSANVSTRLNHPPNYPVCVVGFAEPRQPVARLPQHDPSLSVTSAVSGG